MTTEQEYSQLGDKLARLKQQQAVLVSKEQDKAQERADLEQKLKAAGVDVTKLDEEQKRLEAEVDQTYQKARGDVESFEQKLAEAAAPTK
jgi:predicted  nucleic acid-binding Zn-ribbon protein